MSMPVRVSTPCSQSHATRRVSPPAITWRAGSGSTPAASGYDRTRESIPDCARSAPPRRAPAAQSVRLHQLIHHGLRELRRVEALPRRRGHASPSSASAAARSAAAGFLPFGAVFLALTGGVAGGAAAAGATV